MEVNMRELFEQFVKEKRFLDNLAESTIRSYTLAFDWFEKLGGGFSEKELKQFVLGLRENGMCPSGCNVKIRSINSFLSWCFREGHCQELKIKQLKTGQVLIETFTDAHIRAFLRFRPKGNYEWRLHTIVCLLIDTGARIDEILNLDNLDLDNLLIKISGKGNKERIIPISVEMRKILFLYQSRHQLKVYSKYIFPTNTGTKIGYHNFLRDFKAHCKRLGIKDVRTSMHGLRHYFAQNYLRQGGDIYRLSRILGHTNLATTQIYLRSMGIEAIREAHQRFSPLGQR